ncbi:MAG: GGDEF domain-containing protein [Rhodoferax sp.]
MPSSNQKTRSTSGSLALLALGLALAMASSLGLREVFGTDGTPVPNSTEPDWFVGVLALLALSQLLRYAHTQERSSLATGATACLGIWIFRDGGSIQPFQSLRPYVSLHVQQIIFSATIVGLAWWLALKDRRHAFQIQQAQTAQLQQLRQTVERMQSSQSALEAKIFQRTHELHQALAQIEVVSAQDALTGLANRKRFEEVLKMEWGRAARSRQSLSIALIDVDWLSSFNTCYGHDKGDDSLCKIVRVLQTGVMRSSDLIARYRGGCFALLAPDTDAAGILSIANYLCQEVVELDISHTGSPVGRISISVGVATSVRPDTRKAEALLVRAQAALALAKTQGRNRVVEG